MGQEVRAHSLNVALSGSRETADGLKVLLSGPTRRKGREGNVDNLNRSHCEVQNVDGGSKGNQSC